MTPTEVDHLVSPRTKSFPWLRFTGWALVIWGVFVAIGVAAPVAYALMSAPTWAALFMFTGASLLISHRPWSIGLTYFVVTTWMVAAILTPFFVPVASGLVAQSMPVGVVLFAGRIDRLDWQ